jgi:sugar phosphate isomerase/epimerase
VNLSVSTFNYERERKEEADIDQAITEIIEDGFGVEISLEWSADPKLAEPSRWDHLKELVDGALAISLHTRLNQYDEDALKGEIDMCAYLDGQVVVIHVDTIGVDETTEDFSHVRELAQYAQQKGVILALENGRLELLRQVIDEVDLLSPDGGLGICIDVGHANLLKYGHSVERYLDEFREKLIHLHLADNFRQKDDHLAPGEGTINWKMVLSKLEEFNFRGFGAFEINTWKMTALRLRELDFKGLALELEPWEEVLSKLGELGFSGFGNEVNNHLPRCIARRTRDFLEDLAQEVGWE